MNQYPIWIGLTVVLIMVCIAPTPVWWMIAALGIGANGLVVAANGWKMPVQSSSEETTRHVPMGVHTRHKWLGDVIPTGLGKASLGDFLIAAGILGVVATRDQLTYAKAVALFSLAWWASGWAEGFNLLEKWPAEARRDCRKNIPIVAFLLIVGNLLNARGCSSSELQASAKAAKGVLTPAVGSRSTKPQADKPQAKEKWRNLGQLAPPPFEMLTRLKKETAKQERALVREEAEAATVGVSFTFKVTPKSARSGPFCRVTCAAHHGGVYDVETVPELCRADWIPPNTFSVPGWYDAGMEKEVAAPWPGPAQPGFEHYKLYWSELQSTPKVIHLRGQ